MSALAAAVEVPERALAIYAHPDDTEIACGGTLAAWAAAGAEIHLVICTQGEKGAADADTDPAALAEERAAETAEAAAVLGLAGHELLGYPDGEIDNTVEVRGRLVERIRALRPEVVLGHDPTAVFFGSGYVSHHDHRSVGWATLDACAPAAASPLYFPDAGPPHQVATVLLSGTLEPDAWIDIATAIDQKVAALRCHRSQLPPDTDLVADVVRERARETAEQSSSVVEYAEAFRALRLG
jgi:LmbE family N-acetylglucosaminyl deacetylase